tara:strand:- start:310 stop:1041 length:732 start_codon:yes stop_codon:yes gene_type:complete
MIRSYSARIIYSIIIIVLFIIIYRLFDKYESFSLNDKKKLPEIYIIKLPDETPAKKSKFKLLLKQIKKFASEFESVKWHICDKAIVRKSYKKLNSVISISDYELTRIQFHRSVWKKCVENEEVIIVLESDILIQIDNLKIALGNELGVTGNYRKWDLFQLSICVEPTNYDFNNSRNYIPAVTCLKAYLIKPSAARWLLRQTCVVDDTLEKIIERLSKNNLIKTTVPTTTVIVGSTSTATSILA